MGKPNVDVLLRRMSAKQFREWIAFYELEPFGDIRADYRSAQVVQVIAAVNRGKDQKVPTLQECLLSDGHEKPKQTWQEQERIMKMWAIGPGGA